MAEISTASWKEPYQQALHETDKQKLAEMVQAAEAAIFRRFQELTHSPDHHEERRALDQASDQLLSLKVNQLGWPPVVSEYPFRLPNRELRRS
jgi:hypothetical protein